MTSTPLSFNALARGKPFRISGFPIYIPKTSELSVGEDFLILIESSLVVAFGSLNGSEVSHILGCGPVRTHIFGSEMSDSRDCLY